MALTKQGRVEGASIVFSSPLPLSDGTEVSVQIETLPNEASATPPFPDFASLPFFGMWADRADLQDATAWVATERSQWPQRATRRD